MVAEKLGNINAFTRHRIEEETDIIKIVLFFP